MSGRGGVETETRLWLAVGMALPKHMPARDGLRGVAILLVILAHVGSGWVAAMDLTRDSGTIALPSWLGAVMGAAGNGV